MNPTESKAVVVTGASSGIGRACVSQLVQTGWRVFATVRKPADAQSLQSEFGEAVAPILMDVTDRATVTGAGKQICEQLNGRGLDGLVNVAGIGMVRPVEYVSLAELQHIFDINVFGQIAVTQALLPLLRRAHGRIVNIGSVGAHLALPFGGPLNASKSAFQSFSDAMRLELRPFGIFVSTVEPGAIKTPAVEKTLGNIEAVIAALPASGAVQYGEMLRTFVARGYAREMAGSPPEVVARAVQHALTARRPRTRYVVGKHTPLVTLTKILPDLLLDPLLLRTLGLPTSRGAEIPRGNARLRRRAA